MIDTRVSRLENRSCKDTARTIAAGKPLLQSRSCNAAPIKMPRLCAAVLLLLASAAVAETLRPVNTYSIVARDPETGQLGVATQSHWFSVGATVPWAQSGVGAVATQSFAEPAYGARGLVLMGEGQSAPEALTALVSEDSGEAVRQVAMIDAQGRVAVHTGSKTIAAAGHHVGENYAVAANLMTDESVWPAMAEAFEQAKGDLAERLLVALEAAQAAGGDIRGKQSAAILVVKGEPSGKPWNDRLFDLRVEDHPTPVAELRRLVRLQRAYHKLNEGDEWVAQGDMERAMEAYRAATGLVPDRATNGEAAFWTGIALVGAGRADEALPWLRRAAAVDSNWIKLVPRLVTTDLVPDDPALLEYLRAGMESDTE